MATLTERIEADYKTAFKAREQRRIDTLRLVKAAIQRVSIEKRKDRLDDPEVLQVLNQQVKQCRETLEAAKQGGRQDILDQASVELAILTVYLPQQLSSEAIKQLVDEALIAVGSNQGQIMKFVMQKAAGSADGKIVSQLVAERLKQAAGA